MRHTDMKEWRAWRNMRLRCTWAKWPSFHRYGGRGITVCERWQVFTNFLSDMGRVPEGMSLDRINNDGNYEPANCRWASKLTQSNNSARALRITFNGETHSMSAWARIIGISTPGLQRRMRTMPLEKALRQHPLTLKGEQVVGSKLTPTDISMIRNMRVNGQSHSQIAKTFGVHRSSIGAIIRGERWRHIT